MSDAYDKKAAEALARGLSEALRQDVSPGFDAGVLAAVRRGPTLAERIRQSLVPAVAGAVCSSVILLALAAGSPVITGGRTRAGDSREPLVRLEQSIDNPESIPGGLFGLGMVGQAPKAAEGEALPLRSELITLRVG